MPDELLTEAPQLPLSVFGQSSAVFFKFISEIPDRVVVTVESTKDTVTIYLDDVIPLEENYIIHKMAARKIIQTVSDNVELTKGGEDVIFSETALCSLALKHGILSQYTSFISVEDNAEVEANMLGHHMKSFICTIGIDDMYGTGGGQERFRTIASNGIRQQERRSESSFPIDNFASTNAGSTSSSFAQLVSRMFNGFTNPFKQTVENQVAQSTVTYHADVIVKILDLSDIEGHYAVGPGVDLEPLIGIAFEKINKEKKNESWLTLVIISVLEYKHCDSADSWKLAVGKSIRWARGQLGEKYEEEKATAVQFVKYNLK